MFEPWCAREAKTPFIQCLREILAENTTDSRATLFVVGRRTTPDCDLSFSIVFCSSLNANTSWWAHEGPRQARADDTDQGERLGGVHAVLYPPTIAALKRGEGGGGGFGIKDGIKQAGWNGKVLVRQRIIAGFDPSRPSHLILLIKIAFSIAPFGKTDSAARRRRRRYVGSPPFTADARDAVIGASTQAARCDLRAS